MQILVFGATGSLGSHIVKQSLEKGYSVKAFTRNAKKLEALKSEYLTIVEGDVLNFADVERAIKGVDAVICALGDGAKGKVRGDGTLNIIHAMEKNGIKRLICQTTLGVGDSWHNLNFFWKHIMFGFLLKKVFLDHKAQEKFISACNLDFTIVRPSAFTNEPPSPNFKIGFDAYEKKLSLKIPKADVAGFMIEQLDSATFLRKTVCISN